MNIKNPNSTIQANILDRSWRYVPASKTDIRKTFRRIRAEQKEREQAAPQKVLPIRKQGGK